MSLAIETLRRIVASIWSTQLGLDLEDAALDVIGPDISDDELCVVELIGGFNGLVVQRCSRRLSKRAAGAAFAAIGGDVAAADVRDTVLEIAHMTAGNLKSLLPGPTTVSLPYPYDGDEFPGELVVEAGFAHDGDFLVVMLYRYTD